MTKPSPDLSPLNRLATLDYNFTREYTIFNLCALLLGHAPRFEFEYRMHRDDYPGLNNDPLIDHLDDLPLHYTYRVSTASTHDGLAAYFSTTLDPDDVYPDKRYSEPIPAHRIHGEQFGYPEPAIQSFLHYRDNPSASYDEDITACMMGLLDTEDYSLDHLALIKLVPWNPAPTQESIDRAITEASTRYDDALAAAHAQDLPALASTIRAYYEKSRTRLERELEPETRE